jgi:hypothetical protein
MSWHGAIDSEGHELDRDTFYKAAIRPGVPNAMQFVIDVPPELRSPNTSFSQEGLDQLGDQIKTFILARILGTWRETGKPPVDLSVALSLHFEEVPREELQKGSYPWWQLVDEGKHPLEGSHRLSKEQR